MFLFVAKIKEFGISCVSHCGCLWSRRYLCRLYGACCIHTLKTAQPQRQKFVSAKMKNYFSITFDDHIQANQIFRVFISVNRYLWCCETLPVFDPAFITVNRELNSEVKGQTENNWNSSTLHSLCWNHCFLLFMVWISFDVIWCVHELLFIQDGKQVQRICHLF